MRASSVLAGFTAAWVFVLYAFLVPFGAPRYLLPTLAMMAVLAADGIAWAVTESRWRKLAAVAACVFLLAGLVSQRLILQRQAGYQSDSRQFQAQAEQLEKIGVHPPCVLLNTSIAWYIGCSAPWTGMGMDQFLATRTPQGLKYWQQLQLPASLQPPPGGQPMIAYLPISSSLIKAQSAAARPASG
jgi:hypothetical protein